MKRIVASAAAVIMAGFLTACGAASAPHASAPTAPSPTTIAGWLGCALAPYSDINTQDAYDTVAYDSLTAPGDSGSPCSVGTGEASDVITFATQAKEIDWLHQNDLAQSGGGLGTGYVELVEGPLWIVTSANGVVGSTDLVNALVPHGGKEVTTF